MSIATPQLFLTTSTSQTCFILDDTFAYGFNTYHYHNETQITLIVSGYGLLHVENMRYPFKAGDFFVIGSNQAHMFNAAQQCEGNVFYIHLLFDNHNLARVLELLPEFQHLGRLLAIANSSLQISGLDKEVLFQKMALLKGADRFDSLMQLIQLVDYISRESTGYIVLSEKPGIIEGVEMNAGKLQKIFQYTKEHFSNTILLTEMATLVNMSVSNFCKYFKKQTNRTYYSYLTEIRIKEACKLLLNREYRISEIAYDIGFQNVISFNRTFRKFTNLSPSQYRDKYASCVRGLS